MAGSPIKRARREAAARAQGMTLEEYTSGLDQRQEFLDWVLGLPVDLQDLLEREVAQPDDATFSHATVQRMAMTGSTDKDIAVILGITKEQLVKEGKDALELGRTIRRFLLNQRQFNAGMVGDRTMLVWLGKNDLGQMDRSATELTGAGGGPLEIAAVASRTRDKLERIRAAALPSGNPAPLMGAVTAAWQMLPVVPAEDTDAAES